MVFGRGKKAKKEQAAEPGDTPETAEAAAAESTGRRPSHGAFRRLGNRQHQTDTWTSARS